MFSKIKKMYKKVGSLVPVISLCALIKIIYATKRNCLATKFTSNIYVLLRCSKITYYSLLAKNVEVWIKKFMVK